MTRLLPGLAPALAPALAMALTFAPAAAQTPAPSPMTCAAQARALRTAVETDYIGFHMALRNAPARGQALREAGDQLLREAEASDVPTCLTVLQRYIAAFDDPHLFLADSPSDPGDRFQSPPITDPRAAALVAALAAAPTDPLYGLWFDGTREIAVLPGPDGDILAVALTPEGQPEPLLAGRFTPTADGYAALLRDRDGQAVRYPARLQKNLLLHMPPLTWVRRAPLTALEAQLISPGAPRGPAFMVRPDGVAVLSLPSFSPEHAPALEALLAAQRNVIEASPLLIIDIRGNEGGSAAVGDLLAPFYSVTGRMEPPPSRRHAVVFASPGLISYQERLAAALQPGAYRDFVQRLLERMKAAPGTLIPYGVDDRDWALMEPEPQELALTAGPARIAVLTDQHVVSAGEAFLLSVGRSPRVTTFGRNSAGSIDYESVWLTTVRGPGFRLILGLPSVAASDTLPVGGLNLEGVPVDVPMDPTASDILDRIVSHYRPG
jgi:hypothetical protein